MRVHLTDLAVRKLKPGYHWDNQTLNFGIRVGRHAKTWVIQRGRERHKVTIGRYPDIALTDARTEAKKLLSTVPEKKQEVRSFTSARTEFIEEH